MNVTLFSGTTGLNTKLDPTRLQINEDTGLRALVRSVNCKIDESGRLSRMGGFTKVESGEFGSACGRLCVKDGWLCLLDVTGATSQLRLLTAPDEPMDFCPYGERIYWGNGVDFGYVEGDQNHDWVEETWPGPETHKQWALPIPHLITERDGILYVACGETVHMSMPGFPGLIWMDGPNFEYSSRINLLRSVDDGLWIGDGKKIVFWGGDPTEPVELVKASYPARLGTAQYVEDYPYEMTGKGVRVLTAQGVCFLGPQGFFVNETKNKIEWNRAPKPFEADRGAAVVYDGFFLTTLEA